MTSDRLQHIDIQGELTTLSPLHIGSGEWLDRARKGRREDGVVQVEQSRVAKTVRDDAQQPYIPATSLKGAVRRHAKAFADELFGTITDHGKGMNGNIGALQFRGARMTAPGFDVGAGETRNGIFVHSRTRLDPGRGTADSTGLFSAEMIAPGSTFEFRLRLSVTAKDAHFSELVGATIDLLAKLAREDGFELGRNTASGDGRIRLSNSIEVTKYSVNTRTGALEQTGPPTKQTLPQTARTKGVVLSCVADMPFLIVDSEYERPDGDTSAAHLKALRRRSKKDDIPLVTGSTIKGAMRARAAWLNQIGRLRAREGYDDHPAPIMRGTSDLASLSALERLFGVTGSKGKLKLSVRRASGKQAETTSVKIDRFSGAPIENALFKTDADRDVCFELHLSCVGGGAEETLFESLVNDLKTNGLMIGHGSSRGFGWFSCKEGAHV